ncbi:ABC transporter permease [Oerskovia sp. Sa4CUA1]|jgi:ABC-2 type transport system permease protein|uniref:Transport permease protein n=1 Tax=Oerskovia rustica TaxID=2762237 RepID=A0ABR8RM89_9CELL|nr:ABC transporter permease [Oerskovia rustica]
MAVSSTERTASEPTGSEEFRLTIGLIWNLARRQLGSQYKRTALGRLWSLLNPLASIAIYSLVFGLVMRGGVAPGTNSGITSFAVWIAIGVIAWGYLSGSIMSGMNSLTSNTALLTKVYFPRWVLLVAEMVANTINHLPEIGILIVLVLLVGGPGVLPLVPLLLGVVLLTGLFATGVGLTLSLGMVYFRDLSYLWGIFNQIWLYISGIVFPLTLLVSVQNDLYEKGWELNGEPIPLAQIARLNPAQLYIEAYRSILYDFSAPSLGVWLGCLAWAVLALAVGILVFRKHSARIVEAL